jgi:hypothetical protein
MASRTVTVRSGAPGMLVSTAQYATPPGRLTVSCGLLQHQMQSTNVEYACWAQHMSASQLHRIRIEQQLT